MVGKAAYGNTCFIQGLIVNNIEKPQNVQWVSGIKLFSMRKFNLITKKSANELDNLLKVLAMLVLF